MSYVVSARKYRPKKFEDVVGQEHITATLKNALLNDKLAHAFLFCGPRGVGKTTCARLLAKVINMQDHKAALADGSYADMDIDISMNIIELDAASNNSVENIRALTEQVRFQPQSGRYKVFIIDEVHMLSTAAFNAFLKTLEEPPPYAIFILATTEKHKILPTILSRCQLYDFRRIQIKDIITQLQHISELEGVQAEYDALSTIAEKADGAMRDALSIYDRISSASGGTLSYSSVIDNLNLLDYDYFFKAIDLIMREDGNGLLLLLNEVLKNGFEGDTFMNGLCKHVRNLMYCKQEPTQKILQLSDQLKDKYLHQSDAISYSTILNILSLANQADINYPKAKDKRLHIEIALLKICYASRQAVAQTSPATTPTTQKKNLNSKVSLGVSQEPISHAHEVQTPSETAETKKNDVSPPIIQKSISVVDTTPASNPSSDKAPSTQISPKIRTMEDFISRATHDIGQKSQVEKEVSLDEVRFAWDSYIATVESPTSKSVLKNIILQIHEDSIVGLVPSNIAKEEIQQEINLYTQLRDYFNRNDLHIEIKVDRASFPDSEIKVKRKLVAIKEKYDHLVSINPKLDQLIDVLNLKPIKD